MQFQADILKTNVVRPEVTEVTAIGAAYLAGLAIGFWSNVDEIQQQWQINQSFEPDTKLNTDEKVKGWNKAVTALKMWTELS